MAEQDGGAQARVTVDIDNQGVPTVALIGEIDISNFETVRSDIDGLVPTSAQRVTFELGELQFMDSSGITVLLQVAARVPYVEVRNPSRVVRRIIETTGIAGVLHLES
jgi:anti-anti-sigma factor